MPTDLPEMPKLSDHDIARAGEIVEARASQEWISAAADALICATLKFPTSPNPVTHADRLRAHLRAALHLTVHLQDGSPEQVRELAACLAVIIGEELQLALATQKQAQQARH